MPEKRHPGITMHKRLLRRRICWPALRRRQRPDLCSRIPHSLVFRRLGVRSGNMGSLRYSEFSAKAGQSGTKPLSILAVPEASEAHKRGERVRWHKSFNVLPVIDFRVDTAATSLDSTFRLFPTPV